MAPNSIKYVWKIPKPDNAHQANSLMDSAYYIAIQADPSVCEILIRSDIQTTTTLQGTSRPVAPYIKISTKNEKQCQDKTHDTIHGFTATEDLYVIVGVSSSGYITPDSTLDTQGNEIWPEGLPSDVRSA